MKFIAIIFVLFGLACVGCENKKMNTKDLPAEKPIGIASMEADGTIVLQLRAELDGGKNVGEGYFRYSRSDADYSKILKHVGGLKPGESKPFPPWSASDEIGSGDEKK